MGRDGYEDIARAFVNRMPAIEQGFEAHMALAGGDTAVRDGIQLDYGAVHGAVGRLRLMLDSPMPVSNEEFRDALLVLIAHRHGLLEALAHGAGSASEIEPTLDEAEAAVRPSSAVSIG